MRIDGRNLYQGSVPLDKLNLTGYTPSADTDLVSVLYLKATLAGLYEREPVRLASTDNIDLATGGLIDVDGVETLSGDRILVKDQTDKIENGIYIADAGQWIRSSDADDIDFNDVIPGVFFFVMEGNTNVGAGFYLESPTGAPDIEVGTDQVIVKSIGNTSNTISFRDWAPDTGDGGVFYAAGVGVKYSGSYFVCNTPHISGATFAENIGKFDSFGGSDKDPYTDIAALLADQGSQDKNVTYHVTDATTDTSVVAGSAGYRYNGVANGLIGDYTKVYEGESLSENILTSGNFFSAVRGVLLTGLSLASSAVISAGDSILVMAGKLQAQIIAEEKKINLLVRFIDDTETFEISSTSSFRIDTITGGSGVTPTIKQSDGTTDYTLSTTVSADDYLILSVNVAGNVKVIGTEI